MSRSPQLCSGATVGRRRRHPNPGRVVSHCAFGGTGIRNLPAPIRHQAPWANLPSPSSLRINRSPLRAAPFAPQTYAPISFPSLRFRQAGIFDRRDLRLNAHAGAGTLDSLRSTTQSVPTTHRQIRYGDHARKKNREDLLSPEGQPKQEITSRRGARQMWVMTSPEGSQKIAGASLPSAPRKQAPRAPTPERVA